ncbi:hypothetical protein PAXRUDRAFT_17084 [Paxillus rubicundulus Ve08.2h10]|uniref:Unplaced genomic scaffold scaffold_1899, whole genome shotgun sequence n=1 Tax=Paxillus rubicundulus Ve08.2h10 TaxID=930991 RepID=A0A0D0C4M0_9AGAM|nr:hypothetical protein PAXRUDRAFT_17084 [Paxillus rubicundulus Ve08.2h10]
MPAQRKPRAPYNYSEETLTRWIPCPHCGKQFKPQGFKKHEASCNTQSQAEEENAQAGHRFDQALRDQLEMQSKHGAALNDSSALSPPFAQDGGTPTRPNEMDLHKDEGISGLLYEPGDGKPGSPDHAPWCPFQCKGDFEFAEIALDASLNQKQVDDLLDLISCVAKGTTQVTLKNEQEL